MTVRIQITKSSTRPSPRDPRSQIAHEREVIAREGACITCITGHCSSLVIAHHWRPFPAGRATETISSRGFLAAMPGYGAATRLHANRKGERTRRDFSGRSRATVVNDGRDETSTWRELGVGNWARDRGLLLTKDQNLYDLWGGHSRVRILSGVELADVERYLENL